MSVRKTVKLIYKVAMIAATVVLAALAFLAYQSATPGTGDILLSIILVLLALFALLSIPKLDWQDDRAETYRGIIDDMRARFPVTIKFTSAHDGTADPHPPGAVELPSDAMGRVSVNLAEPEVHRVDTAMVDEARRMAASGESIDAICRMIDPDHDRHDGVHQAAFRRIVDAMIRQG